MKKKILIIAIIVVLLILLIPIKSNLKDSKTIEYKAILYKVSKIHQLYSDSNTYEDGLIVKILGFEVFNNVKTTIKDDDIEDKPIINEEQIKDKEALSLETPAGVAMVGTIKKDEKGWYFIPEQPLNIKLTYFIDQPEEFSNITRFEMLPNIEDGIDKAMYESSLVTIFGAISNPRSLGTLYLIPYKIEKGKIIEHCYAEPNLEVPTDKEVNYNYETLSDKVKPIIENNHYVYNPYILSKEILESYGNDFADLYIDFMDAYLNYETSIKCPNQNLADYLSIALFYEFPMYGMDISYNSFDFYNEETKTISWQYTKSKTEHDEIITKIKNASNEFLKGIEVSDTDQNKAKKLYSNFNKNMKYDYVAFQNRENIEPYYAYVDNTGICVTFSKAYLQLLSQIGLEGTNVSGTDKNGDAHVWNAIKLNDNYYFVDTTYQITSDLDNEYYYFGEGLNDRLNDGFKKDDISFGIYNIKSITDINLSNESF